MLTLIQTHTHCSVHSSIDQYFVYVTINSSFMFISLHSKLSFLPYVYFPFRTISLYFSRCGPMAMPKKANIIPLTTTFPANMEPTNALAICMRHAPSSITMVLMQALSPTGGLLSTAWRLVATLVTWTLPKTVPATTRYVHFVKK